MSSRFVFLSLSRIESINHVANEENLAYVCTGQLRATRHFLSSVTFFPSFPKPCNLTPVWPSNEIALKSGTSSFGKNALFRFGLDEGVEDEGVKVVNGASDVVVFEGVDVEEMLLPWPGISVLAPVIVPFQTSRQESVLNEAGTWSQKRSCDPRTKKPEKVAFPVSISPERKPAACLLTENT